MQVITVKIPGNEGIKRYLNEALALADAQKLSMTNERVIVSGLRDARGQLSDRHFIAGREAAMR